MTAVKTILKEAEAATNVTILYRHADVQRRKRDMFRSQKWVSGA
jgi:hypothetical protein